MNVQGFANELLSYLVKRSSFSNAMLERPPHPFNGPKQVYRSRSSDQEPLAHPMKVPLELIQRSRDGVPHAQGYAHRGGDTYRRRASHYHVFDCDCYFFVCLENRVKFVGWKPPLIDHYDAFVGPLDCSYHCRDDHSEWLLELATISRGLLSSSAPFAA
jgi:hypothetical protein